MGWSGKAIRARYDLSRQRFQQIVNTWKKRAVEFGYIQIIPPDERSPRCSRRSPLRIDVRFVRASTVASTPPPTSSLNCIGSTHQVDNPRENESDLYVGFRPRRKCATSQIPDVLHRLGSGRSVLEVAREIGVSPSTIRDWTRRHQMRLLLSENAELRKRLADSTLI